jgi:hypothetical protein
VGETAESKGCKAIVCSDNKTAFELKAAAFIRGLQGVKYEE